MGLDMSLYIRKKDYKNKIPIFIFVLPLEEPSGISCVRVPYHI